MDQGLLAVVSALESARSVALFTHVNPDGDTLGSALALSHALHRVGKRATVFSHNGVPDICAFLPGSDQVCSELPDETFDLYLVIDTGDARRIGKFGVLFEAGNPAGVIDHHDTEGGIEGAIYRDATAAATGELVMEVIEALEIPVSEEIAMCLFSAIITDTGMLRYPAVDSNTFHICARLLEAGSHPGEVYDHVYERRSLVSQQLLGYALERMNLTFDGHVLWTVITEDDFKRIGATDDDTEGITQQMRCVGGPLVNMLLRETKPGSFRASVRSKSKLVDVAIFAGKFGGGGHKMAAGFTIDCRPEEIETLVVTEMQKWTAFCLSINH